MGSNGRARLIFLASNLSMVLPREASDPGLHAAGALVVFGAAMRSPLGALRVRGGACALACGTSMPTPVVDVVGLFCGSGVTATMPVDLGGG